MISSVKVPVAPMLAEVDRCSWDHWLTLNNRRRSFGPKLDNRPRLEGVWYLVHDKAAHAYSALPYPSVTHTLAHIINQTPALPGLAQWACYKKASAHGSRVGWTPARSNRTDTTVKMARTEAYDWHQDQDLPWLNCTDLLTGNYHSPNSSICLYRCKPLSGFLCTTVYAPNVLCYAKAVVEMMDNVSLVIWPA